MDQWTRRKFFVTTLAGGALVGADRLLGAPVASDRPDELPSEISRADVAKHPVIISAANGVNALQKGMDILKNG